MKNKKNLKLYDEFHAFLVENANYDGYIELPCIKTSNNLPNRLVTFSKAMAKKYNDFDCWVMFYEYDKYFERIWHNPSQYVNKLKKFRGIISPDFSLYRNMPLVMQQWNTYRSRALAFWFQQNGIEIIPNIRFNDERTYEFCFCGIDKNSTVAVGTHGCIRKSDDRQYFKDGMKELVQRLSPKNIVVYGTTPDDIFKPYKDMGINIIGFECVFPNSKGQVSV